MFKQQLGDGHQLEADLKCFAEVFYLMLPAKERRALRLIERRIVIIRLSRGVSKSAGETGEK